MRFTENKGVKSIEAKVTFADGQEAMIALALDNDQAWGNVPDVLWRTVPVREAIFNAMIDEELWEGDEEE